MLKYTGEPGGDDPEGVAPARPAGDARRRALSEPSRVKFVVWAVVVATVVPLMAMPIGTLPAQIAVMVAVSIVLWIVFAIQREHRRIEERERAKAIPRCRACGQRLDVSDPEDAPGSRCIECGRVLG